ncbi:amidohydrolase family protein [Periconia macrospinosa]|uniref:Amidohydrolase family protein n=1 Tax=Periconia macrospinosa TaxID=97972 RepID=A0A2V1DUB6_9PLEO|nr:amidohydrolase family protein [Periconia macrospinosa]
MSTSQTTSIFTNGRFFKGAAPQPASNQCMVVKDGKIAYIGPTDAKELESYNDVHKQDLKGHYVLPSFIDAHMHFLMLGQSLAKVELDGCESLQEIRTRISQYAKENPGKERILCKGWMQSMTDGQAKAKDIDDLDPRPIYIDSKDLHSTWCNSAALQELGVNELKEDPVGGIIERDSEGRASGLLSEACVLLFVWPYLANVLSTEEKMGALRAAIAAYHKVGTTACVDMAMDENAWEAILALREASNGKVPMRIGAHWCIVPGDGKEDRLKQVNRAIELSRQYNSSNSPDLRILGIKIISDGVIDACTAALKKPYTTVASPDPIWTPEMLDPVVKRAIEGGLQCAIHAIGDQAVHNAINVIEKYGKPGQRHRVEHLELTAPEDAARLGKLGITASVQPVHADPAILRAWPKLLGPDRVKRAFAYREFAEHGATLAIGTDTPTAPHMPLPNLYVATTRKSARQPDAGDLPVNENFKLGLVEAVTAATQGAAYSCFDEDRVGSLEVGKQADFVVVDMSFEAEDLLRAEVKQTWFDGEKVFGE